MALVPVTEFDKRKYTHSVKITGTFITQEEVYVVWTMSHSEIFRNRLMSFKGNSEPTKGRIEALVC